MSGIFKWTRWIALLTAGGCTRTIESHWPAPWVCWGHSWVWRGVLLLLWHPHHTHTTPTPHPHPHPRSTTLRKVMPVVWVCQDVQNLHCALCLHLDSITNTTTTTTNTTTTADQVSSIFFLYLLMYFSLPIFVMFVCCVRRCCLPCYCCCCCYPNVLYFHGHPYITLNLTLYYIPISVVSFLLHLTSCVSSR